MNNNLLSPILMIIVSVFSQYAIAMGTVPQSHYHNPILEQDSLADPHIIQFQGKYYLYGTYLDGTLKGGSDHYDVYISENMKDWDKVPNIFSKDSETLWAPDVFYNASDETFYLYYSNDMNIGVATSKSPTGPFVDQGILIENAIDAHMFKDNGEYYLYYSSVEISNEFDMILRFLTGIILGTKDKAKENILVQKMDTPLKTEGDPILLLEPNIAWEKGVMLDVNEGAWMFKNGETYYLMYSGSETMFGTYAIGYATADNPIGPFIKSANNPIVATRKSLLASGVYSPGHHSVITNDDGKHWIVYHQKQSPTSIGFSNRYVCKDEMTLTETGELVVVSTGMRKF